MKNFQQTANKYYSDALLAMENNADINEVRNLLIKTIDCLDSLAKNDLSLKDKATRKIRTLLLICKEIRDTKSYIDAYQKLTGKVLKTANKQENLEIKQVTEPKAKPVESIEKPINKIKEDDSKSAAKPEDLCKFDWDSLPQVTFDDVAGLDEVKSEVYVKVIQPLLKPELYEGYDKKNGGGLLLYGPPGTGKTMIAAAIAREINAKFCCIGPSDLLTSGIGNTEKAISQLFNEARNFKCAVIFFDEVEALAPASTRAQVARQVRSELLRQMQGLESYGKETGNILYLIAATNKPWDVDPAFVRPGRFGTRVYVGLPDDDARRYMIQTKIDKIIKSGKVEVQNDINFDRIIELSKGFNGADMSYLLDEVQEISIARASLGNSKTICMNDFDEAFKKITSSVQPKDIEKLNDWKKENC